jgi:(R,R)-butanediol dehydrogenase/meso-butanediol dehydrogenase/diacetyl reductase
LVEYLIKTAKLPGGGSMKAIVLKGPNDYALQEIADPKPGPEDVEIKVRMAGICGTDVHLLSGNNPFAAYPVTPGHEYCGEILSAPDKSGFMEGERVTVYPAQGCGKCEACERGWFPHCPEFKFIGVVLPGGCFAERVVAHHKRIFRLPKEMSDEVGAMVEPTAVSVHANRRAELRKGMKVVVIGGGTIGLLTAQVARAYGASQVVISEPLGSRRALAKDLGFTFLCNPMEEDIVALVKHQVGMPDVVFDVVSTKKTLMDAEMMLRPNGVLVLVGLPHPEDQGIPYRYVFGKELRIIGSRTYFIEDFPEAIELLNKGKVKVQPMVSKTLPLDRFAEGVTLLEKEPGNYMKILINPFPPA